MPPDDTPAPLPRRSAHLAGALWRMSPLLLTLACVAVFLVGAREIQGREAVYPVTLAVALLAVCLYTLVRELLRRAPQPHPGPGAAGAAPTGEALSLWRPVAVIGLLAGAGLVMATAGFTATAAVLVLGILLVLGVRRPLPLLVTTAATAAASHVVFIELLGVPLPGGWLG